MREDTVDRNLIASPRSRGSVILLYWHDCENRDSTSSHVHKLEAILKNVFGFTTHIWELPRDNCQFRLHFRILEFAQTAANAELLIVYYIGHGSLNEHYRLEWSRYVLPFTSICFCPHATSASHDNI